MNMFREHLTRIIAGEDLTEAQMTEVMDTIFTGEVPDACIGALMAAQKRDSEALEHYQESARVAETAGDALTKAKSLVCAANVQAAEDAYEETRALNEAGASALEALPGMQITIVINAARRLEIFICPRAGLTVGVQRTRPALARVAVRLKRLVRHRIFP